ncbi:MAG TPA: hypothetical protein VGE30_01575 [Candidatus Saccharimonadales bacterium]
MSEQGVENQTWRAPVLVDPRVATVFEMKQQFQAELDRFPVTRNRADFMISTLNRAWPHPQGVVEVTGRVVSSVVELHMLETDEAMPEDATVESIGALICEDGKPEEVEHFVRDQRFKWQGFGLVDEPFLVGGEPIGKHYKIQLALARDLKVALPKGAGLKDIVLHCRADERQVAIEYFSNSMEYLELSACDNFPQLFEFLDENLKDGNTPGQNIMALSGLLLSRTVEVSDKAMGLLETYVDERVGAAEERTDFVVASEEDIVIFYDQAPLEVAQIAGRGEFLADVHGIRLVKAVELNEDPAGDPVVSDDQYEFRLVFTNVATVPSRDSQRLQIRLRDIRRISSIRDQFHNSYAKDE